MNLRRLHIVAIGGTTRPGSFTRLTPLGVCIAGPDPAFAADGRCISAQADQQLTTMAQEVMQFALMQQYATAARAAEAECTA